jgi:hypothetical protein
MTPASQRKLGNIVMTIGLVLLLVTVSGMAGWTRSLAPSKELVPLCMVLIIWARALRRRGARSMS